MPLSLSQIMYKKILPLGLCLSILFLSGCASTSVTSNEKGEPEQPLPGAIDDPCEEVNRCIFEFNDCLDISICEPMARCYKENMPEPVQLGIHNFLTNLELPGYVINDLLQCDGENAGENLWRFLVNSTLGIGGIIDYWDEKPEKEDFGQTLGVAGIGPGPYIVLPFLGPSNLRDGTGMIVDIAFDPLTYINPVLEVEYLGFGRYGIEAIDTRAENLELIETLKGDALDYYARIRSVYSQHRQDLIDDKANTQKEDKNN